MPEVIDAPETKLAHGGGTGFMKRHIFPREGTQLGDASVSPEGAAISSTALCGQQGWDRAHPTKGELCGECLAVYQQKRPGWPVPR